MTDGQETEVKLPEKATIAYGAQDPFTVHLPIEKVDVKLRLATGMDSFTASQRWKNVKTLDQNEDAGLFELEVIAKCILKFPGHPEFGPEAIRPVTFDNLLFLKDIDIKMLKLAYMYANLVDPQTESILTNLALGHRADALQEALWLTISMEGGITLDAALQLPEKTRWEMIGRIKILLGLNGKKKEPVARG